MGMANLQATHHNLVTADVMTQKPPQEYQWFHVSQPVALHMVPVSLPLGQKRPMMEGIKIQPDGMRFNALDSGIPHCSICCLIATD
jgi:hypothetical protein